MKLYLEFIQITEKKQNTLLQIEVSSKEEAISLISTYENEFQGLNYIKRLHTCYNDEIPSRPCMLELL